MRSICCRKHAYMSQQYIINRLDKREWLPKLGVGKVSIQNHVLYHGGHTKHGFTLSDPVSQQLILTCKPEGNWKDYFLCRAAEVFKTNQVEICRIQYSLRNPDGKFIINDRVHSLKTTWNRSGFFKRKNSCKYEWEGCTLDLAFDEGMCVANAIIEDDIDPLPFIAVSYYLWKQEEFRD